MRRAMSVCRSNVSRFLGPARQEMKVASDPVEKIRRPAESREFGAAQHPARHQILDAGDRVEIPGDPHEDMEVSQPALSFLDIGFQDIARVAGLEMPPVAFLEFGTHEGRVTAGYH